MTPVPAPLARLEQESPQAARLAELVSLAVRVDAGLLRRFRTAFLPDADVHVESQLWFSPIVESSGPTGFQIAPAALDVLRERLSTAPADLVSRVRALLDAAHANVSPAIRLEETVNGIAVARGAEGKPEIEAEIRTALRTMIGDAAEAPGIARWAVHAATRLHPIARDTAAASALFLASSTLLRLPRSTQAPPASMPIADVAWALAGLSSLPAIQLSVAFVTGGIQFRSPETDGTRISLPATDPVLVEIEWKAADASRRELREAGPDVLIPLDGDPSEVTLTTLAGDVYELAAGAFERERERVDARTHPPDEFLASCEGLHVPGESGSAFTAFLVGPDLWITSGRAQRVSHLVNRAGVAHYVTRRRLSGTVDQLVALRMADSEVRPLPIGRDTRLPEDQFLASVARSNGWRSEWRTALVLPGRDVPPGVRYAIVFLTGRDDAKAFAGSPVFHGAEVIGAISEVGAASGGSAVMGVIVTDTASMDAAVARAGEAIAPEAAVGRRVFISSTTLELEPFVAAARDAVLSAGCVPVEASERMRATPIGGERWETRVASGDIHIVIVGWRHRNSFDWTPSGQSLTALEYRQARVSGKPVLVFLAAPELRDRTKANEEEFGHVLTFRDELMREPAWAVFGSPKDLHDQVLTALDRWRRAKAGESVTPARSLGIERMAVQIRDVDGRFEFSLPADESWAERDLTAVRQRVDELLSKSPPFAVPRGVLETISDMVVPQLLRSALESASRIELRLDPTCAAYPWELMLADTSTNPPSGSLAMTRTLLVERGSARRPGGGRMALGLFAGGRAMDPHSLSRLDALGIQVEFRLVATLRGAVRALGSHYSCVHIAGPPVFEDGIPAISFGDGGLRPNHFRRLERPPQVAFVQLRHAQDWKRLQEFAARFAQGLLEAGVSAVVCSGWVTELAGTQAFADGLFEGMVSMPFAQAVREARRRALREGAPLDWAAFHCYGDPDFRLALDEPAPPPPVARARKEPVKKKTTARRRKPVIQKKKKKK